MLCVTVVENFTPQMARTLLALNGPGRVADPIIVARYVRQMLRGEWRVDGNTFKVNRSGHLIDGQHRLLAQVEANLTIPAVIIVTGVPDDAAWVMDPPGLAA